MKNFWSALIGVLCGAMLMVLLGGTRGDSNTWTGPQTFTGRFTMYAGTPGVLGPPICEDNLNNQPIGICLQAKTSRMIFKDINGTFYLDGTVAQ